MRGGFTQHLAGSEVSFSIGNWLNLWRALGRDVKISVTPARKAAALKAAALHLNLDGNSRRFWGGRILRH